LQELPIKLSQASGVPYYRQVGDQITQLIRSGRLRPGSQLPSVRDLARQLLVSVITVRRAYEDLDVAKLIVLRQGQGTFVAEAVEQGSRKRAVSEAKAVLSAAFEHCLRMGLDGSTISALFEQLLGKGETHGTRR
jgi:GntR family transcriptional regulator